MSLLKLVPVFGFTLCRGSYRIALARAGLVFPPGERAEQGAEGAIHVAKVPGLAIDLP